MRYYRFRRKASKKFRTICIRVLFVLVAAILITGLAIVTGNMLLRKVERAEESLHANVPPSGYAAERTEANEGSLSTEHTEVPEVYAAGFSLTSHTEEESILERLRTIAATYDTMSLSLCDHANTLLYTSPALSELLRMPTRESDPVYARLRSVVTTAVHTDLRCSAVLASSYPHMPSDTAALVDSTLANELHDLGFHELLLTDVLGDDADTDAITNARRYVQSVHAAAPESLAIGICLPVRVYLNTENAKQLQMLSSVVDFLTMDAADLPITGPSGTTLSGICLSLSGSFQLYSLRVLLTSTDPVLLAGQYQVLTELGITNLHFIGEVSPELLTLPAEPEIPAATDPDSTNVIPTTNPYATTTPSTPSDTPVEAPTETTPPAYRTDSDSWY